MIGEIAGIGAFPFLSHWNNLRPWSYYLPVAADLAPVPAACQVSARLNKPAYSLGLTESRPVHRTAEGFLCPPLPPQNRPKPFVLVLMPFAKEFNDIYTICTKGAAADVGA